jgi:hypothetical protein
MIHIRPEKTECSYFPGYVFCTSWLYVFVLPDAILRTYMVFFWLHHHNIVLPSVIMLYFLSLSHSTSRCHNIVFSFVVMLYFFYHDSFFMQKLRGIVYFSEWVFVHFVLAVMYFRSLQCCTFYYGNYFLHIYEGTCVFPRHSYLCVLPFSSWQSICM